MKKQFAIVLALMLSISILIIPQASAMTLDMGILHASLWSEDRTPMACIEYLDPTFSTWIEVYLLKKGEVTPNMGTTEIGGELYSIVGIQTIDANNPQVYRLLKSGVTILETDLYLGNCSMPETDDPLYITLGLTDPATHAETILDPIFLTMPEAGAVSWAINSRLMQEMTRWMRLLHP